jgi:TRAP-type mannitol/chloroaromatic compound transport system substrate-binding protein
MKRGEFLASIGAGAVPVAALAIAQMLPQVTWRLAASWPKSLDTLYGACEPFAKRVGEITGRRFHEPGVHASAAAELPSRRQKGD